uniref:Pathogenesis-related protein PR-1 type n=1 Tax=Sambucus nigra TaxID=4202 RepID=PR1_SAMNI|nr:RecName: Full=Pathogenesis-related protein PR-1 type; Flags: Precursor [Sambucus nigra]CAA87071.1 pathogenesis-related protein, PR-1 type [Sambucus nigra]
MAHNHWCNLFSVALVCVVALVMVQYSVAQNSPQDYVDAHNAARSAVNVGPVTWDESVAAFARQYAQSRAGDCRLVHSGDPRYGENLAFGSGFELTGRNAVDMWVAERNDYNPNTNTCAPGKVCGHYTQVVWRNSVRIGCARVRCNNGAWFITCNYSPPGNYAGQRPY